jgi:signal transduction histidine kinase
MQISMTDAESASLEFRPRARIIRTIGDQLISGPEAAVIELVKNAYDADATKVAIKFVPPLLEGRGRIEISDDGHGMTLSDIQDKWMEPATSSKLDMRVSRNGSRRMMGSKGIGRFAAAKLGRRMALNSVSSRDKTTREILIPEIDWSMFTADRYLSDISIDYLTRETEATPGTLIEIMDLNEDWTQAKLERLHLELRRLISPISLDDPLSSFDVFLDLSACTVETCGFDGAAIVRNAGDGGDAPDAPPHLVRPVPLLTACDYELSGHFAADGQFAGTFQIKRAGTAPISIDLKFPVEEDEQACGEVSVRLFIFDREADALKQNLKSAGLGDLTAGKARQILDSIAGVAIYRSGFRIRPYGDAENDWLTLDRRRVQDPSLRIGHNQIAGYVAVSEEAASGLIERSSREGFEQNGAFTRLARLLTKLLARVVEPRRQQFREKAGLSRARSTTFDEVRQLASLTRIRGAMATLAPKERESAEKLIDRQESLLSDKLSQLEERQRLLEASSSLGAILGEVLHEGSPAARYLAETSARLDGQYRFLFGGSGPLTEKAKSEFTKKLPHMKTSGEKLANLFASLRPLAGGKRGQPERFNPVNVIYGARDIFLSSEVEFPIENDSRVMEVIGYRDDLATALVNLYSNSVHWLTDAQVACPEVVTTILPGDGVVIFRITDNGPGIPKEFVESIFDVGFTLKDTGTGLGLNIAREALARSGATLAYDLEYDDGARFEIRFPV